MSSWLSSEGVQHILQMLRGHEGGLTGLVGGTLDLGVGSSLIYAGSQTSPLER